ncbi:MFS transporter [Actinospica robiniae]|uniref:MFS transporter n=1 Tax=Actinospica robiniae TaxID=304901 RepID=UPI00041F717F|nr:MFS transporter [Actinospica robiniae]
MDHSAQAADGSSPASERLFGTGATVAACVAFVLLGSVNAFFGPAIPALRSRFGLEPAGAGAALSMFFAGAVAGVLIAGVAHARIRNDQLLTAALSVMAVGAAGFALAPNWPLALAAGLLCGLGAGGMDYGLNALFSVGFGVRSAAMLGILNACFGLGAVAGPLLISLVGVTRYPVAFGIAAALLVVAAFFLRAVRTVRADPAAHPKDPGEHEAAELDGPVRRRVGGPVLALVAAFLALYALQVTVETGAGAWEPTFLQDELGHTAAAASTITSGFWLMLTVGRLLIGPMTDRWSAASIVTVSCIGTTACLALATVHPLAPWAFAGAGLFNAPVFPVALPWLSRSAPRVRWAATGAILTANIGGAAAGPATGLGIERFGTGCVPWLLAIVSALCVPLALGLARATRGSAQPAAAMSPEPCPAVGA